LGLSDCGSVVVLAGKAGTRKGIRGGASRFKEPAAGICMLALMPYVEEQIPRRGTLSHRASN